MNDLSLAGLEREAETDTDFITHLIDLGALPPDGPWGQKEVRRVRLLRTWAQAGLEPKAVLDMVDGGSLTLTFLDSPGVAAPDQPLRADRISQNDEETLRVAQAIHQALGLPPVQPTDDLSDDAVFLDLVRYCVDAGAEESSVLRLLRVYGGSMQRAARAEAEMYENEIEASQRSRGLSERELIEYGTRFGEQVVDLLRDSILTVYRRHRERVWIEHSINHAEVALEEAGLYERVENPPAICFVDLTGYTRLSEESGDQVAARLATTLATLVEDISRRYQGQAIRWLGDGGMFVFRQPHQGVLAGLEMVQSASGAGLPPMHVGIHAGPVVFQEGDIYGRAVNLASRIASYAQAHQVVVSDSVFRRIPEGEIRFRSLGPVAMKNVAEPVLLYEAEGAGPR